MTTFAVTIFTDGSCLGNPGKGGWAAILQCNGQEKVMSGGYDLTTNNRMELLAVLESLATLKEACHVTLFTDSQYVRNAVEKKWLASWQRNGWKTASKSLVKNRDLWERLVPLLKKHTVVFQWVRGHSGHPENERCDELARAEASRSRLPKDEGFLASQ